MNVKATRVSTKRRSPEDGAGNRMPPLDIENKTVEGTPGLAGSASLPDVTLSAVATGALTPSKKATRPGSPSAERTPCVRLAASSDCRCPKPLLRYDRRVFERIEPATHVSEFLIPGRQQLLFR